MPRITAFLLLIAAMALIGANVPAGKVLIAEVPVFAFIAFRFALASAVLAAVERLERGPALLPMSAGDVVRIGLMGLVGSVLFTLFLLEGTRRTSAVDAGIITATLPAAAAVMARLVLGRRLNRSQVLLIALAVVGVGVLQAGGGPRGTSSLVGNALVMLAVLCEASFVLLSGPMSRRLGPIRLSLAVSLAGLAMSAPLVLVDPGGLEVQSYSAGLWALAVWYVLSASVFSTILWYRGAAHAEPWEAGLATTALPLSAVIVSAVWLGEALTPAQIAGGGIVVASIVAGALLPAKPEATGS